MKYRILLAGKNRAIVDDFFRTMDDRFECLTTSNRSMDIANHMLWFKPHAFIYCFASESKDDIIRLTEAVASVEEEYRQIILIGDPEHCEEFNRRKPEMVKMVLHRPITANSIKDKLLKYFEKNKVGVEKEEKDDEMENLMAMAKSFQDQEDAKEAALQATQENVHNVAQTIQRHQQAPQNATTMMHAAESAEENSAKPQMPDLSSLPTEIVEMKHILVIDDDLMMLRLVKAELKDRYNVATAVSGKVGLKFLERKRTDLIILDYEMPEENGAEVLEKLRANPMTRNIPVIFLTGMNNREKIKQLVAMKPQGYLLKPIKCEQLVATIKQIIG
ncbi:MAG: response regulator [Lachnospiraceae bacterium]|nr:response regulator [Lachnospiraceae bacterium]